MLVELFMKFRISLTLSTGFQNIQLRLTKFTSTQFIKLNNIHLRETIERNTSFNPPIKIIIGKLSGKIIVQCQINDVNLITKKVEVISSSS